MLIIDMQLGGFICNMKRIKLSAKNKRIILITLCVVLALILVLLIAGTAYMESLFNLINKDVDNSTLSPSEYEDFLQDEDETDPTSTAPIIDPDDVDWGNIENSFNKSENIINIMLIGQDRREGWGRSRSDVMLLCTINKSTKEITLTSFMRDMYVQIPGYQDNRINVCYLLGGMNLLDTCLETNFGIKVDGNVEVDFFGFMDLIDLMGGVDMYLTQKEADYLNQKGNWEVTNEAYTWNLKEGVNHLTGSQALAYARTRNIGNADFDRTERQRKVISALFDKCKDLNVTQLKNILEQVLPMLTTDLSNGEIMQYLFDLVPILSDLKINTQRIPADGTYQFANIRGMEVLLPNLEANRNLLKDCMKE